jgi:hypothetical protein
MIIALQNGFKTARRRQLAWILKKARLVDIHLFPMWPVNPSAVKVSA